jgi:hypothetical protein
MFRASVFSLALALMACASSRAAAPDGVFLPRLDRPNDTWPAALISGRLSEENGCILLETDYVGAANEKVLLIWPHEATAVRMDTGALRISIDGAVVGDTGSQVKLGGGLVGERRNEVDQAETMIGKPYRIAVAQMAIGLHRVPHRRSKIVVERPTFQVEHPRLAFSKAAQLEERSPHSVRIPERTDHVRSRTPSPPTVGRSIPDGCRDHISARIHPRR